MPRADVSLAVGKWWLEHTSSGPVTDSFKTVNAGNIARQMVNKVFNPPTTFASCRWPGFAKHLGRSECGATSNGQRPAVRAKLNRFLISLGPYWRIEGVVYGARENGTCQAGSGEREGARQVRREHP
jgi:hypothetical protein